MSLKGIHIIFILAVILLGLFTAWWAYGQYAETQGAGYLIASLASILTVAGMLVYLRHFTRKVKMLVLAVLAWGTSVSNVLACTSCFYGSEDRAEMLALRLSVLSLLAVLVIILGLFINFFLGVARRSQD